MELGGVVLKHRITLIILASISVLCILIGAMTLQYKANITDNFEKNMRVAPYYHLSDDFIKQTKKVLNEELEFVKSRKDLKWGYYWLSQLYFYSDEYKVSNDYLFRALQLSNTGSKRLQVMIYMAISSNFYLLGDFEKSQEYYEMAQQDAIKNRDLSLLADVYQSRAKLYVNSLSRLDAVANLAQLATYLDLTPMRVIETNLLMMEISLISHNYEGVMYYLYQSWLLAQDQESEMLEQYILYLGAMAHYSEGRFEKSMELLKVIGEEIYEVDPMGYLYFFINSYYQVYGYETSVQFLTELKEKYSDEIEDYYGMLMSNLYISEGLYEQALESLETVKDDNCFRLWRKAIELEGMRKLNSTVDLYAEYEDLLNASRQSSLPITSVYFIYSNAKECLSEIQGANLTYADEFSILQDHLKEPSFEEVKQVMDIKKDKSSAQRWGVLLIGVVGLGCLASGYVHQRRVIGRLQKEVSYSKKMDTLTQSLNYEWLDEEIYSLVKAHESLQIMLFDLGFLDKYSEVYGYKERNRVLRQMVDLLKANFPTGFVVRYNGPQFIVLMFDQQEDMDKKMNQAIEAFGALKIKFNTGTEKGQLLMKASGLSYELSHPFDLDRCLREVQQQLQSLMQEDE